MEHGLTGRTLHVLRLPTQTIYPILGCGVRCMDHSQGLLCPSGLSWVLLIRSIRKHSEGWRQIRLRCLSPCRVTMGCVPSPKVPVTLLLSLSPGSITAPSLIPSDLVKLVASYCSQSLKLSLYPTHTFYINN